jgi:hypothetical protein
MKRVARAVYNDVALLDDEFSVNIAYKSVVVSIFLDWG